MHVHLSMSFILSNSFLEKNNTYTLLLKYLQNYSFYFLKPCLLITILKINLKITIDEYSFKINF